MTSSGRGRSHVILVAAIVGCWSFLVAAGLSAEETPPTPAYWPGHARAVSRRADVGRRGNRFRRARAGRDHWYVTFGNYADHSETPAQQLASRRRRAFTGATAKGQGFAA